MKRNLFHTLSIALLAALSLAAFPHAVYAQLSILSIQPSSMAFGSGTTITIQGTDFVDGSSVVILNGYGALTTTFQNTTVLTAVVPSNVPAGTYDVVVSTGTGTITATGGFRVDPPPPPTNTPPPFSRPQFAVYTSRLVGKAQLNGEVTLKVVMENVGPGSTAYNTQAVFSSSSLTPTKTGGIAIVGTVPYDQEVEVAQTFIVTTPISGQGLIVADMTITYYDASGTSYSDKFTLSIPVTGAVSGGGGAPAATRTPTGVKSSQLVITGYSADKDPLQPGEQFTLNLTVQNVGNAKAQRITMIIGGGSSGGGNSTPQPGGVSGGGGDFANFAPVGASNVQSLGDLNAGDKIQALQSLIVNVSTNPGAYPMRITFSYLNDKNEIINDEQVITLLVYSLPNVNVSFYRPPDPFFAGQPGALPLQVVNIGKRLAVLSDIQVTAQGATIENGSGLVGSLDAGGFFTLDSVLIADQPGMVTLEIEIDYTDDFNQARVITKTLEVEVGEAFVDPSLDPSLNPDAGGGEFPSDGGMIPVTEETFLQKVWRFILGLLGLDSSAPSGTDPNAVPQPDTQLQPIPGKG